MKEVKKGENKLNKEFLLDIYNSIKLGKNPTQISKDLSISKQALNYYLSSLKTLGYIQKIGYGVWKANNILEVKEVKKDKLDNSTSKKVRGHAFVWKIRLNKKYDWKVLLEKKGLKYILVNKGTPRIMIKDKKVWLGQKSIVIFDLESYFGANSIETRKYAVNRLLEIVSLLEREIGVYLNRDKISFKVSRQHYSLIKNCLAIQCNQEGKRINVSNDTGLWFTIDNSYNLDEAETLHPKTALIDSIGIQKYFNEHKETNFEVTPKFILNTMAKQNLQLGQFTEQIKSHLKLINEYRKENISWRKNQVVKIEKELNNQKRLSDF